MSSKYGIGVLAFLAASLLLTAPGLASTRPAPARLGAVCTVKGRQARANGVTLQCKRRVHGLRWAKVLPLPAPTPYDRFGGSVTVFAAASLTESFNTISEQFQHLHPAVRVTLSFGASSSLATQILNGAPADVFASASTTTMQQVVDGRLVTNPQTFARNRMIIVTGPGNPLGIRAVSDLARPGVKVAMCQIHVPCGIVARQVFAKAGASITPVTFEADVKSVLTKVLLGEVDAGMVYVSDARSAGDKVTSVVIPADVNADTTYPIGRLVGSANPEAAQAFIDFVLGDRGAAALARAGFTVL